ncbi:hypothetical protein ACQRIU_004045 [Beauveria bassiana]
MVPQAAAGNNGHRQQSRPLDESDAAPTPTPTPTDTGAESGPATKKRKVVGSGRGVANLNPEQLAKKRANDREAQRAIRERTKNQIQTLERRIQELTNLQPYQDLQAVIEAKAAVERENAEMRQRLATIVGMLQPFVGAPPAVQESNRTQFMTLGGIAASAEQQQQQQQQQRDPNAPRETTEPGRRAHSPPPPPSSVNGHATQRVSDLDQQREQRQPLRHGLDMGPERLGLGFLLDAGHQVSRIQGPVHGTSDTPPAYRYPPFYARQETFAAGSVSVSPGPPSAVSSSSSSRPPPPPPPPQWQPGSASTYSNAFPSGYPYQGPHATADPDDDAAVSDPDEPISTAASGSGSGSVTVPRYAAPVRTTPPTCPLDSLLLDFLQERRQLAAEGQPVHEVIGPRYPSVSSLLNPAQRADSHPLSRVFTDILAKFPDISGLPERVAALYVMFLVMRWQVAPTRENYDRLPPWARPLRAQLSDAHPPWIDHVPFPRMRAALVRAYASGTGEGERAYPFDHFSVPYTKTLTLSWPYRDTDTLLQSPHSEELMINPVFERHLRNLDNWRLGTAFAKAFPELADMANIPEAEPLAAAAAAAVTAAAAAAAAAAAGTGKGTGNNGMTGGRSQSPGG